MALPVHAEQRDAVLEQTVKQINNRGLPGPRCKLKCQPHEFGVGVIAGIFQVIEERLEVPEW